VHPATCATIGDEPGVLEHFEVEREARLGGVEEVCEVANAALAITKATNDGQAGLVRERMEQLDGAGEIGCGSGCHGLIISTEIDMSSRRCFGSPGGRMVVQIRTAELRIHTKKARQRPRRNLSVVFEHDLSRAALDAFYRVYNRLGYGFLESVYVNALALELERDGHQLQREAPIAVTYDGVAIGNYRADLLLEGKLILEVKAEVRSTGGAERQLMNYLRCSDLEVGILLIFGLQPRFKRLIHTRDRKLTPNK